MKKIFNIRDYPKLEISTSHEKGKLEQVTVFWEKRKTRRIVRILCPHCAYDKGTEDENDQVECQMCGKVII